MTKNKETKDLNYKDPKDAQVLGPIEYRFAFFQLEIVCSI